MQLAEQNLRDQVALFAITGDRRHDLVEVQVRCVGAIRLLLAGAVGRRCLRKQQAGEMTATI
jgi:hypothetical protein